jgi:hypothetical protein
MTRFKVTQYYIYYVVLLARDEPSALQVTSGLHGARIDLGFRLRGTRRRFPFCRFDIRSLGAWKG